MSLKTELRYNWTRTFYSVGLAQKTIGPNLFKTLKYIRKQSNRKMGPGAVAHPTHSKSRHWFYLLYFDIFMARRLGIRIGFGSGFSSLGILVLEI